MRYWRQSALLALIILLTACVSYTGFAPVRDINTQRIGHSLYYTVQPGETLYAVAWRYELDYQYLAELNGLKQPFAIHPGQKLRLSGLPPKSISHEKSVVAVEQKQQPYQAVHHFLWPVKGKVVGQFSRLNKGIDIAGYYNEPITATAAGEVVYAGNGLRGYGNLLIIKHNRLFLTAYAHNSQLLVKVGDKVMAGQKIARMGMSNAGKTLLHFEIRKQGKSVNPFLYLKT